MQILSRDVNEIIVVGDNVKITLLGVDGDKIKIGIEAPHEIKVLSEELREATKKTNVQALDAPTISFDLSKVKK